MPNLERLQKGCFWLTVVSAGLGLITSSGCSPIAKLPPVTLWALYPILLLLGLVAGIFFIRRSDEIDQKRWQVAEDSSLTSGEREYAHKYAERERLMAGISFGGIPLMFGYWMAHQVEAGSDRLFADLVPVMGVAGFAVGLLVGKLTRSRSDPRS